MQFSAMLYYDPATERLELGPSVHTHEFCAMQTVQPIEGRRIVKVLKFDLSEDELLDLEQAIKAPAFIEQNSMGIAASRIAYKEGLTIEEALYRLKHDPQDPRTPEQGYVEHKVKADNDVMGYGFVSV